MTQDTAPDLSSPSLTDANQAASEALKMAMYASNQGTFAVGGLIVDNKTGAVIKAMHNNVLKPLSNGDAFTWDPTAHGERQLVYWYYENRERLGLPPPSKLTIVTSLDPCVMCTGALLTAGFNVGVIAIDDFAGINYDESFSFNDLPPDLREQAKRTFGYYAAGNTETDPSMYVRDYQGSKDVAFHQERISSVNLMGCGAIFSDSGNAVRESSSDGKDPAQMTNPAELPEDSPIKTAYRKIYPNAFRLSTPQSRIPDRKIIDELVRVAAEGKGSGNAVAFIDSFGNLILCMPGREDVAPVYTPFMEVTQAYAGARWGLMDDPDTRLQATDCLTSPKYGTFLFLYPPSSSEAPGIMTLGAYGSTMEGRVPNTFPTNFQYVHPPHSALELTEVLINLPPLYTDEIQIAVSATTAVQHVVLAQPRTRASVLAQPRMRAPAPKVEVVQTKQPCRRPRISRHRLAYAEKRR